MARRESIEPFLRPSSPLIPPSTLRSKAPPIFVISVLASLALLWVAFFYIPSDHLKHHHHSILRSNDTLLPITVNELGNWTLPLPPLPLTPEATRKTCDAVHHHSHGHHGYYWADPDFIDPTLDDNKGSLTYSLAAIEGYPQGLAESLLELFSTYGLALSESRHFILDDASWPWGGWKNYFIPQSPLLYSTQSSAISMLPCPRNSHHLLISHATRTLTLGHAFVDEFELPQFSGSERQKRIFGLIETGYKALFHLKPELEAVARERIRALTATAGAGEWLAIHIRRGDYVPRTWAWHDGVIPLEAFVDAALEMRIADAGSAARVVVVSDDEEVQGAPQLAGSYPAAGRDGGVKGGYRPEELMKMTIEERVIIGQEFLIQLRVVAELAERGGTDKGGVLCASGSATCRLLAVMLGWEKAIGNERWKDIDGDMGWSGVDW
ncbi:hypothetical protein FPQ18DRAFT_301053 [Pyronema domesticum]|nr:hypothetical protein FPQ18DRAFT_301053 [Pyronema domesticum]